MPQQDLKLRFDADGFVALPAFLSAEEVEEIRGNWATLLLPLNDDDNIRYGRLTNQKEPQPHETLRWDSSCFIDTV